MPKRITKILPMGIFLFCMTGVFAQTPEPGKGDKPKNPPPYANQPPLGTALPPEGTTPHDTPNVDKSKNDGPKTKAKKAPKKKKKDT